MRSARVLPLVCCLLLDTGCGADITHGPGPRFERPRSSKHKCYLRKRMHASKGSAKISWSEVSGSYRTTYTRRVPGISFYRGDEQIPASEAVSLFRDADLRRRYRAKHGKLSNRKKIAQVFTWLGATMFTVGLVHFFAAGPGEDPLIQIGGTGVGSLVMIIGMWPLQVSRRTQQFDVYDQMFTDRQLVHMVPGAITNYNVRVATSCGLATGARPHPRSRPDTTPRYRPKRPPGPEQGRLYGPCYSNRTCNRGLRCSPRNVCVFDRVQRRRGTQGAPCLPGETCEPGLDCYRGICRRP